MMGYCTYDGPIGVLCEERVQISRFARKGHKLADTRAADNHGVAFPDLLNTDEGQLQHNKMCLLS